eukprot:3099076-Alexandrium_andersonii.AAC.1
MLVSVAALRKLGAVANVREAADIFTMVDATKKPPLEAAGIGHLLLDLAQDVRSGGGRGRLSGRNPRARGT